MNYSNQLDFVHERSGVGAPGPALSMNLLHSDRAPIDGARVMIAYVAGWARDAFVHMNSVTSFIRNGFYILGTTCPNLL